MSGLTDLQAVQQRLLADLTAFQTAVSQAVTDLQNIAAGDSDTTVEQVAQSLGTVASGLEAATASLNTATSAVTGGTAPAAPAAPATAAS